MLYTPKISGQAKTFRRAVLAHLQGISPSAGGNPCQYIYFFLNIYGKKKLVFLCIGAFICIDQETLFLPYVGGGDNRAVAELGFAHVTIKF